MALPADYVERVYAGVLGKIIGVYLGRPFEGWSYERIMAELGPIEYYVHEQRGVPLVVTDDDISGTFTFLRALPDHGNTPDLTPAQIGQTWLNYIIERRTILWWGGMGNSTEHTAFLRLQNGVAAPASGSIARNGQVVAEQIGAQIFVDGWAMVAPGDPELAAELARRAGSVSHDGAALHGAQALAAMEALAFVERDTTKLLDCATRQIPRDSIIARLYDDLREWHERDGDWQRTRERIVERYGYDRYGGNCHVVPNHALILLGLLYGRDDLGRALLITNTSGWDTDCNSGNLGCLLGIKNGLAGIDAGADWRGPVADRMFLPTADGGRAITDAVRESYEVVNVGRALQGQAPLAPKAGARFHFELPGAVQGFQSDQSVDARGVATVENVAGHSAQGTRSLQIRYRQLAPGRVARVATATFVQPDELAMPGYQLLASPTLYPGQLLRAGLLADSGNPRSITARLFVAAYGPDDQLERRYGPPIELAPGSAAAPQWRAPATGGAPIAAVGIELRGTDGASGSVYLDFLTWDGAPEVYLGRPEDGGSVWRRAWVDAVDHMDGGAPEGLRLIQDRGRGLVMQGTAEWRDYRVSATLQPHMAQGCGIAARVGGLRRYYALVLGADGMARLVRVVDAETTLATCALPWTPGQRYQLALEVRGAEIRALVDGRELFVVSDPTLGGGGIAVLCDEGRVGVEAVEVAPLG